MALGSLVLARLVSYALLLAMAGLPFYALVHGRRVLSAPERMSLAILMVGALGASLWWAVADVAEMAGLPVGDLDQETFSAVLGATPLGALRASPRSPPSPASHGRAMPAPERAHPGFCCGLATFCT